MPAMLKPDHIWTAEEFLAEDQHSFGDDWRYELIDGQVVGHSAPSPEHGAILAGLTRALGNLLAGMPGGYRPEAGSAATPRSEQRNTARIPDLLVRCGEHPRIAFEVVSQSEMRDWRGRDLKRRHLQAVEGMQEIVELFQDDHAAHMYRRTENGAWVFEAAGGPDAVLHLDSVGISVTLREIYAFAAIGEPGAA